MEKLGAIVLTAALLAGCPGGQPGGPVAPATVGAGQILVEAKLVHVTPTPDPRTVLPYRRAMVGNIYEVQKVLTGVCEPRRIMVAQWAIRDSRKLPVTWQVAQTYRLVLEKYSDNPKVKDEKLVMDTDEFDLPLYYGAGP
jgi:hypothetical protein